MEAGVHFGHQTHRWNPSMKRFLFGERNGVHIIDLDQTLPRFRESLDFIRDIVAGGGKVLFVGTKRQTQASIKLEAERANPLLSRFEGLRYHTTARVLEARPEFDPKREVLPVAMRFEPLEGPGVQVARELEL